MTVVNTSSRACSLLLIQALSISQKSHSMPDYFYTSACGIGTLLIGFTAFICHRSPTLPHGAGILCFWILSINLLSFVDSIIWSSTRIEDWWDGQIYCDINIRIKTTTAVGIPGASIGLCRFLMETTDHHLSDIEIASRNKVLIDYTLGLIIPFAVAGLKILVMPFRFGISGVQGCRGYTSPTWPALPIYYIWNPLFSATAAIYTGWGDYPISSNMLVLFLNRWWRIRGRLRRNWDINAHDGVSHVDFLRISLTLITVVIFYFPASVTLFILSILSGRSGEVTWATPYSWEAVHGRDWSQIYMTRQDSAEWTAWFAPALAVNLFALMGMTKTAGGIMERCLEGIHDSLPVVLRFSWIAKISAAAKRARFNAASNDVELANSQASIANEQPSQCETSS